MPDGKIITTHKSTKGNGNTIDINDGGNINKVRVQSEK